MTTQSPENVPSDADLREIATLSARKRGPHDTAWTFDDLGLSIFVSRILAKYAAPATNEWKEAVDGELVTIQSTADSYHSAREAVSALIEWHVSVANDSAVNGAADATVGQDEREAFESWDLAGCELADALREKWPT